MKTILFALFSLFAISSFAADQPIFLSQPVATQSGLYELNPVVDGVEGTNLSHSGIMLEVVHAKDESILGATFPGTFIFGTAYFPSTPWFAFSTTDSATKNSQYQTTFNIVAFQVLGNGDSSTESQIASGTMTLDPLQNGDGHTFDITLNFSPSFTIDGNATESMTLRAHRVSNAEVDACLPVAQFSPIAPFGTLPCN